MTNPFGDLAVSSGNFVKWPVLGTSVTGVILRAYEDTPSFDDAVPCPHIDLQTVDGEKTVSATQTALRNLLIQRQSELTTGRTITITYSGNAGNAKLFDIAFADAAAPAPAVAAAAPAPAAAPAAPAAGMAPPV